MPPLRGLKDRAGRLFASVPRRERMLLGAAMLVSFAIVVVYAVATRPNGLAGDQDVYDFYGRYFTHGDFWWWTAPFGYPHPSAWKAPGYPGWVGLSYSVLGSSTFRLALLQSLLAPITVFLTWMLGRRIAGPPTAIAAAGVVAVFPFVWEYFGLLYPEVLAIPLMLATLLVVWDRAPTPGRAVAAGALMGVSLLVRPTAFFVFAGIAAAWVVASGGRRGVGFTALSVVVAALVVLPWTVRNATTDNIGFIPISVQDAAAFGTFNHISASDPENPYAWRPEVLGISHGGEPPSNESSFRSELQTLAWDYIKDHPLSVPKAFFWNGITRFWDLRRPSHVLDDAKFQGRSRAMTITGLAMYWVLLPLAAVGVWRLRRRPEVVWPVLAMAITASIAFTVVASTRYRAPLEPLIAILACSLLASRARAGAD